MDHFYSEITPDSEPVGGDENKTSIRRFVIDFAETLVISLILFFLINAVSARIRVQSISMQPTLFEGDFVFVNKLAYKLGKPSTGDIIIFRFPPDPQREPYIKRVIGTPGDSIRVADGQVYVNDVQLNEPYLDRQPVYSGNWVVPEGSLFVLGDNRNNSSDSHAWGPVPLENVIGKAELLYFPFERWKTLNPRAALAAAKPTPIGYP